MKTAKRCPAKGRPRLDAGKRKSVLVTVKFDIEQYSAVMEKAAIAGLNKSEYLRHSALRCTVIPRLNAKDLQAIRILQGIKTNLNTSAKFLNYAMKMGLKVNAKTLQDRLKEVMTCVVFVSCLIDRYRNGASETTESDVCED